MKQSKAKISAQWASVISVACFLAFIIIWFTPPLASAPAPLWGALLLLSIVSGIVTVISMLICLAKRVKLSLPTVVLSAIASCIILYLVVAIVFWGQAFGICGIECGPEEQHHWVVRTNNFLTGWLN